MAQSQSKEDVVDRHDIGLVVTLSDPALLVRRLPGHTEVRKGQGTGGVGLDD